MIVGYNHNVTYRGVCFHVQTEDSGIRTPHLITLLYHGGTIICSQKTSYADILNVDNLEHVVEDLAKEQHKGMLRRLKKGDFDQRIVDLGIRIAPAETTETTEITEVGADATPLAVTPALPANESGDSIALAVADEVVAFPEPAAEETAEPSQAARSKSPAAKNEITDLDDLIFSYLSGDGDND